MSKTIKEYFEAQQRDILDKAREVAPFTDRGQQQFVFSKVNKASAPKDNTSYFSGEGCNNIPVAQALPGYVSDAPDALGMSREHVDPKTLSQQLNMIWSEILFLYGASVHDDLDHKNNPFFDLQSKCPNADVINHLFFRRLSKLGYGRFFTYTSADIGRMHTAYTVMFNFRKSELFPFEQQNTAASVTFPPPTAPAAASMTRENDVTQRLVSKENNGRLGYGAADGVNDLESGGYSHYRGYSNTSSNYSDCCSGVDTCFCYSDPCPGNCDCCNCLIESIGSCLQGIVYCCEGVGKIACNVGHCAVDVAAHGCCTLGDCVGQCAGDCCGCMGDCLKLTGNALECCFKGDCCRGCDIPSCNNCDCGEECAKVCVSIAVVCGFGTAKMASGGDEPSVHNTTKSNEAMAQAMANLTQVVANATSSANAQAIKLIQQAAALGPANPDHFSELSQCFIKSGAWLQSLMPDGLNELIEFNGPKQGGHITNIFVVCAVIMLVKNSPHCVSNTFSITRSCCTKTPKSESGRRQRELLMGCFSCLLPLSCLCKAVPGHGLMTAMVVFGSLCECNNNIEQMLRKPGKGVCGWVDATARGDEFNQSFINAMKDGAFCEQALAFVEGQLSFDEYSELVVSGPLKNYYHIEKTKAYIEQTGGWFQKGYYKGSKALCSSSTGSDSGFIFTKVYNGVCSFFGGGAPERNTHSGGEKKVVNKFFKGTVHKKRSRDSAGCWGLTKPHAE